ncbi:hypothetical protein R3P38DRAFT_2524878, partial [Favolaschia claudopus]
LDQCIKYGGQKAVFRGSVGDQRVVVKIYDAALFDELFREMAAYERLSQVPGVPKYFGVFGPVECAWAALIVQDAGVPVSWDSLDPDERNSVFKIALNIHRAGVHHGDLAPRNVVRDHNEGSIAIIDFGHASLKHTCHDHCAELLSLQQDLQML